MVVPRYMYMERSDPVLRFCNVHEKLAALQKPVVRDPHQIYMPFSAMVRADWQDS